MNIGDNVKYSLLSGETIYTLDAVIEDITGDTATLLVDLDRSDGEKCRVYEAEQGDGVFAGGSFPQVCIERIGVQDTPNDETINE